MFPRCAQVCLRAYAHHQPSAAVVWDVGAIGHKSLTLLQNAEVIDSYSWFEKKNYSGTYSEIFYDIVDLMLFSGKGSKSVTSTAEIK